MTTSAAKGNPVHGRVAAPKPARIEAFVFEDGVRLAAVRCPFCDSIHQHVVPDDLIPHAPLIRTPKCGRRSGGADYRLVPAEDWVEPEPKTRRRR